MTQFTLPKLQSTDFDDYLQRLKLVGDIEEGQYGQYKGRLVLKMAVYNLKNVVVLGLRYTLW